MPEWTQDRLFLFLLFFVPGFISIKIYDLLVPSERRDFQSTLAEAIGYSAVNFAVLLPIVAAVYGYGSLKSLWAQVATAYLILLAAPLVWPFLFLRMIRPRFAAVFVNPVPKPWGVVCRDLGESWIIVHMSDGRRIGGRYARGSQASSYPADEQIYVKEVWRLDEDGRFLEPIERTGGIILSMKDVQAVEFFPT